MSSRYKLVLSLQSSQTGTTLNAVLSPDTKQWLTHQMPIFYLIYFKTQRSRSHLKLDYHAFRSKHHPTVVNTLPLSLSFTLSPPLSLPLFISHSPVSLSLSLPLFLFSFLPPSFSLSLSLSLYISACICFLAFHFLAFHWIVVFSSFETHSKGVVISTIIFRK